MMKLMLKACIYGFFSCELLGLVSAVHFRRMETHIPRSSFVNRRRADANAPHEVILAVVKNNMDTLKAEALNRATPGSPNYQQWLSGAEVDALVINDAGFQRVHSWLRSYSEIKVTWISRRKDYVKAVAPISLWEKLLDTTFYQFEDLSTATDKSTSGKILHRAIEYSIPEVLADDIKAIFYTVQTPPLFREKYALKADAKFKTSLRVRKSDNLHTSSSGDVTVSFLNSYYQISSNLGSAVQNQSVFETSNEYFSPSDLTTFQNSYDLTVQSAISIGGHSTTKACTGSVDCSEGNLDIQYIMGVAQVTSSIYWYVPSTFTSDPFVDWITDVAEEANPPQSNSISWGANELVSMARLSPIMSCLSTDQSIGCLAWSVASELIGHESVRR
jgi:hypothetical protein